jgi:hypothetical protein
VLIITRDNREASLKRYRGTAHTTPYYCGKDTRQSVMDAAFDGAEQIRGGGRYQGNTWMFERR